MMRPRLFALWLLGAGCAEPRTLVPPSLEDARSALVLSLSQPAFAHAIELGPEGPATIELPERVDERPLLLNLYRCSLAELALPAGSVPLRVGEGRAFPSGDRSYRFDPEKGDTWAAVDTTALRRELEPLRLDEDVPPPCNDFPVVSGPELHVVPGPAGHHTLVVLEEHFALMSTLGSLFWIRADLSLEPVTHPLLETGTTAITHGELGEAVIIPSQGPMLRGHPDRGLSVYGPGPPNASGRMHVARSPVGAESLEIFVLSPHGLSQFDGQSWTLLDDTERQSDFYSRPLGIWLAPGEAVFLPTDPESNPRLLYWHGARFTEITLPDIPRSIGRLDEGTVLVGSEGGLLFAVDLDTASVETRIDGWSRPMRPIWVILPLEQSFLLSGWSGLTNELFPDRSFCSNSGFTPALRGASINAAGLIGPDGDVLAVGGAGHGDDASRVGVVRLGRSSALPDRCPD